MIWILIVLLLALTPVALMQYTRHYVRRAEAAFPPTGEFVDVRGIRMHYIRKGSGKPVVFLHGGILSANDFDRVLDLAASKGYSAIAFDRPGNGYSERPREEIATPSVQARLIHDAICKLGIHRPIIAGHSWSGSLIMAYALRYPEEIDGIMLISAAVYGGEAYPGDNDPIGRVVRTPIIGAILLKTLLVTLGRLMVKQMLKATFAPDPVPNEYEERTLGLWLRPQQFKWNREDVANFSSTVNTLSDNYRNLRVPSVIMVGEVDPFNPQMQSFRLHTEIAGSRLFVIPKAGHMIPQLYPEAVIEGLELLWPPTCSVNSV